MCGIAGAFGKNWRLDQLQDMVSSQRHRGPDNEGTYVDPDFEGGLGHNRLSIIDLSIAARQPMTAADGRFHIVFNGEIYNFLELRCELESEFTFKTQSDTEVLLAAYEKWGPGCLDKLIGMFSFIIWDDREKQAFAARDRFGVKPLHYHQKPDGTLLIASEIKALHAGGAAKIPDTVSWAGYLAHGRYGTDDRTFWQGITSLPPGHLLTWKDGRTKISRWYDVAERVGDDIDSRPEAVVADEYFELMKNSVKLRFRSDVPVGINLSGGLDSSTLLGMVHAVQGIHSNVQAFTFITGDSRYDELPWVAQMLAKTNHVLVVSKLSARQVPELAEEVQFYQDEPFGGIPTLAYANLFRKARESGVIVLLDGNGMDEQWAGYDYYIAAEQGRPPGLVQGTSERPVRPECLAPEFASLADESEFSGAFSDRVRALQYRDIRHTKIPRAMRFNDRISMRSSTELREPFLDHRLFELALKQPIERKISNGIGKKLLRQIAGRVVPDSVSLAPKRPVQTPQREWLRNELRDWAEDQIRSAVTGFGSGWLDRGSVSATWEDFLDGKSDNSFYVWQWISLGLAANLHKTKVQKIG